MKTEWNSRSLHVSGMLLSVFLATAAVAQQGASNAQARSGESGKMPSMLSRVQMVDDPELGDLLRVALEREHTPDVTLQIVREVTESYAQIRLLDRQVEEIEARIKSGAGAADVRHEMVLAKAELESKRLVELAHLRQVMGVIPRHALGRQNAWNLRAWVRLYALDDQVYVIELIPPFTEEESLVTHKPLGLMSPDKALSYLAQRLQEKDRLPIRITIDRNVAGMPLSDELEKKAVDLVRKAGAEMEAEVYLRGGVLRGHDAEVRIQPGQTRLVSSLSGRQSIFDFNTGREGVIAGILARPENLPARFTLSYPDPEWRAAEQITSLIEKVAQQMGLARYVAIVQYTNRQNPESKWLGQWRTSQESRFSEVLIRPGHVGSLVEKGQTHAIRWTLGAEGIVLWDGDRTYPGTANAEGALSLTLDGTQVVFQKAD